MPLVLQREPYSNASNDLGPQRQNIDTVALQLSGLIGTARYPDMPKIRIIEFVFANRHYWQPEVLPLLFTECTNCV